jgi:bacterioferritin-associated ferredoxin
MYICLCHGVSDSDVRKSVQSGNNTFCDVRKSMTIAIQCRKCVPAIVQIVEEENLKNNEDIIHPDFEKG